MFQFSPSAEVFASGRGICLRETLLTGSKSRPSAKRLSEKKNRINFYLGGSRTGQHIITYYEITSRLLTMLAVIAHERCARE